jgi:class 3 adenylate cyclase
VTFPVVGGFLALVLPVAFVYTALVRYLGAPVRTFTHAVWIAELGVQVGTAVAVWLILRRSRPVMRWIGGVRTADAASEAWRTAARMPSLHPRLATGPVTAGALVAVASIYGSAHPPFYAFAALVVGGLIVVALGLAIHMVTTGALVRPILAEIDARFPQRELDSTEIGRSSLRPRIVISSLLVVVSSSWLTAGLVARTTSTTLTLTLAIGSGIVVGVIFGLVLTTALSQSMFTPLQHLTRATRRVQQGDLMTRVPFVSNDELGLLSQSFNDMVAGLAEREALRSALGTYVDPQIADRLLAEGEFLKGEDADVTIMFVDIVGFSARAEMMPAELVCNELNDFFGVVLPIVEDHGGHTNKLIGDGLLAVFGTPVKLDDHADRALDAACTIDKTLAERYRGTLRAGIGLHTGTVTVGTMGGGSKLDFTLIGDAVNVASRVEALTRRTGDAILITEATRDALKRTDTALASRGSETVRGRTEPVSLYAVASRIPA